MKGLRKLGADQAGVGALEFALAVPILVTMIYGVFTIGQLFEADAAMQGAIGDGARYATLCLNPTSTGSCTAPTDAQIRTIVSSKLYGPVRTLTPSISTNTTNKTKTISLTYTVSPDFLVFRGPSVTINRSKTAYYAS